jgi:hypothetical protein
METLSASSGTHWKKGKAMKAYQKYTRETIVQAGWLAAAKMMIETQPETTATVMELTRQAENMTWGWANVEIPAHLENTTQVLEVAKTSLDGMFKSEPTI